MTVLSHGHVLDTDNGGFAISGLIVGNQLSSRARVTAHVAVNLCEGTPGREGNARHERDQAPQTFYSSSSRLSFLPETFLSSVLCRVLFMCFPITGDLFLLLFSNYRASFMGPVPGPPEHQILPFGFPRVA